MAATDRARIRAYARDKGWEVAHSETAIADYLGRRHDSVIVSYQSSYPYSLMVARNRSGETAETVDAVLKWLR